MIRNRTLALHAEQRKKKVVCVNDQFSRVSHETSSTLNQSRLSVSNLRREASTLTARLSRLRSGILVSDFTLMPFCPAFGVSSTSQVPYRVSPSSQLCNPIWEHQGAALTIQLDKNDTVPSPRPTIEEPSARYWYTTLPSIKPMKTSSDGSRS